MSTRTNSKICTGGVRTLKHQRQRFNWDCGLTCIMMVMPQEKRQHFQENFKLICSEEGFNKSTWTIDLAYLLKKFELEHVFCTITLGIQPAYGSQPFYAKVIQKDEARVLDRFVSAESSGVCVQKRSLPLEELLSHLEQHGPVIVLTNGNLLQCEICKINKLTSELRACLPWPSSYSGHYIVLCGFDLPRQLVFYHNPSYSERVCAIHFTNLDEARFGYGTDEDAILIFNSHIGFVHGASPFVSNNSQNTSD
ncbi:protein GUCD1 [Neocloeon triangulifer]|uniref:protein GUCD1 n=1 Tax=Neocloeon triangulifer TaxID=2078957 RepID=UPI00286F6BE4|nr:protein GUCD1 [Neocloeon triangulifer]